MDKYAAAAVLEEIATLLELHGANRFKARAFRNAARSIERADGALDELVRNGRVEQLSGFGPATAAVVRELCDHGQSQLHRDLVARTPPGFFDLLGVPGLGPQKIALLREQLGIATLGELDEALATGAVAGVPGFGGRTQDRLRAGIGFMRGAAGRRRRPQALEAATRLCALIEAAPGIQHAAPAGELRRGCETVGELSIVAVLDAGAAAAEAAAAVRAALATVAGSPTSAGPAASITARLADGFTVRVRLAARPAAAATLLEATGSAAHWAALRDRAAARHVDLAAGYHDETAIYDALGLDWVPPELRETGETELAAAAAGAVPRLVEPGDLRGCFHCHTTYSDGAATLEEMAQAALDRGWRYLGITDHSEAAGYAGGLGPAAVARQHAGIDAWNQRHGERLWLFKGSEVDILTDGRLDYAARPGLLEQFDFVIGSVHSGFGMDGDAMTARVLRALDDERLTLLGHPTGRLLLTRDAYAIDIDAVLERAGARGVVVEINADPRRLELDWRCWPTALRHGVRAAINPDAHSVAGLDNVVHGIAVARKAWLTRELVMNTWEPDAVRAHFAARRGA